MSDQAVSLTLSMYRCLKGLSKYIEGDDWGDLDLYCAVCITAYIYATFLPCHAKTLTRLSVVSSSSANLRAGRILDKRSSVA